MQAEAAPEMGPIYKLPKLPHRVTEALDQNDSMCLLYLVSHFKITNHMVFRNIFSSKAFGA